MNLTRSQRRLVAVIGVSGLALVVDKFVLSPSDIQAAEAVSTTTTTVGPNPFSTELPNERVHAGSELAAQFDELAAEHSIDVDAVGNAFLAPADWLPQGGPQSTDVVSTDAMTFARDHALKGVMALGNVGYAMIDDQRLKLGDELGGYRLTAIGARSATFTNDRDEEVVLELQR